MDGWARFILDPITVDIFIRERFHWAVSHNGAIHALEATADDILRCIAHAFAATGDPLADPSLGVTPLIK
jgi:hypothetical protein